MNFNFKECVQSKTFKGFMVGIGFFLILMIVFQVGVFVGFKKADFSERLGGNYGQIFGDDKRPPLPGGMFAGLPIDNLPGSHGAVGQVIKVSSSTLVVAEPNNVEKVVLVGNQTITRQYRDQIKAQDIVVGDFVSILGEANAKGEIDAKFIRVLPPPLSASSTLKNN